jgi:hypothetical protein
MLMLRHSVLFGLITDNYKSVDLKLFLLGLVGDLAAGYM